ncbi:hypothetical protein Ciccas_003036 [Cichlidogyrus casuarinus]|uniref:Uncharacterized protein n=1 Tax=Cichlidogyrus casuarinus TaxID=1844966 RepID=A0ABD2QFJ3_9PLAT
MAPPPPPPQQLTTFPVPSFLHHMDGPLMSIAIVAGLFAGISLLLAAAVGIFYCNRNCKGYLWRIMHPIKYINGEQRWQPNDEESEVCFENLDALSLMDSQEQEPDPIEAASSVSLNPVLINYAALKIASILNSPRCPKHAGSRQGNTTDETNTDD